MRPQLICIVLLIGLSVGPLGFLQLAAWGRMVVVYSRQDGLLTGIRKTFDGYHPCSLCKSIAQMAGKDSPDQPREQEVTSLEMVWVAVLPVAESLAVFSAKEQFEATNEFYQGLIFPPPTPPPRA